MTAAACIGQPISWLSLERYALAELDPAGTAAVRTHLDECAACRAAFASIEDDAVALPPLAARPASPEVVAAHRDLAAAREPALRDLAAAREPALRDDGTAREPLARDELADRRARPRSRVRWALGGGLGAAIAAAAVLLLWLRAPGGGGLPGRHVRVKGAGVVSLRLVRDRGGVVTFDPPDVVPADRWKLELTCGNAAPLWTDVVVYQRGDASFPLAPQSITCGNQVALPGAFRITDGGATICVAVGAAVPDRARLARGATGPMLCASVSAPPAK